MGTRDSSRSLAAVLLAALAGAACTPSDRPSADASRTPGVGAAQDAPGDSGQPAAAPASQDPPAAPVPVPASAADGPGLHRAGAAALKLPIPRTLDLLHVDPARFATALGGDPRRIFTYVRDEIAFEPYKGALRGPRGTLLAMAGNSVDRAALLAAMLASSGQRVRFVRGTLPQPEAERLVTSVWADRSPARTESESAASPDAGAAGERLVAAMQRDAKLVVDLLQRSGHPAQSGQPVTLQSLGQEARDHYWVESSPDGRTWTAMDPSFASATPGEVFAQPAETLDSLPEGIYHHIELRIRTEEAVGGGLATREVLKHSARAADLSGIDVFLGHDAGQGAEANRVRPFLLVRGQTLEGEWFWLKPPTAGKAAVSMVDALGGAGEQAAGATTAESIEIDFANPDGSGETVVREIFDRIGKHRRAAGPPLGDAQIAEATGSLSVADFASGLYDLFFTTGAVDLEHLTHLVPRPERPDRIDVAAGLHRVALAYTALSDALTSRVVPPTGSVTRLFPNTPRLAIAELTTVQGTPRLGLDLRRERVRAAIPGFRKEHLFLAQVLRGVVDGTLERVVLTAPPGDAPDLPGGGVFGTSLLFDLAHAQKVAAVLMAQGGPALRDDVSEDGRARVRESLAAGNVVIAPERPIQLAGLSRYAWWEIEPRYGATTAVTDEGLHQATVEAGILRHDGRVYVFFRTGNGAQARRWLYRFSKDQEANAFITQMSQRFQQKAVEVVWQFMR